ncbi:hypothetical protein HDE_13673 [Halotydeus destructor]|nr:hypothetical protein HDE_13673 [Halotydeus destructor]
MDAPSDEWIQQIFAAIQAGGDLQDQLRHLIDHNTDTEKLLRSLDGKGNNLCHVAAKYDGVQALEWLSAIIQQQGSQASQGSGVPSGLARALVEKNHSGFTPVLTAVKVLLFNGADIRERNVMGMKAQDVASVNGNYDCRDYLCAFECCLSMADETAKLEEQVSFYKNRTVELTKVFKQLLLLAKKLLRDKVHKGSISSGNEGSLDVDIDEARFNAICDNWKRLSRKKNGHSCKNNPLDMLRTRFSQSQFKFDSHFSSGPASARTVLLAASSSQFNAMANSSDHCVSTGCNLVSDVSLPDTIYSSVSSLSCQSDTYNKSSINYNERHSASSRTLHTATHQPFNSATTTTTSNTTTVPMTGNKFEQFEPLRQERGTLGTLRTVQSVPTSSSIDDESLGLGDSYTTGQPVKQDTRCSSNLDQVAGGSMCANKPEPLDPSSRTCSRNVQMSRWHIKNREQTHSARDCGNISPSSTSWRVDGNESQSQPLALSCSRTLSGTASTDTYGRTLGRRELRQRTASNSSRPEQFANNSTHGSRGEESCLSCNGRQSCLLDSIDAVNSSTKSCPLVDEERLDESNHFVHGSKKKSFSFKVSLKKWSSKLVSTSLQTTTAVNAIHNTDNIGLQRLPGSPLPASRSTCSSRTTGTHEPTASGSSAVGRAQNLNFKENHAYKSESMTPAEVHEIYIQGAPLPGTCSTRKPTSSQCSESPLNARLTRTTNTTLAPADCLSSKGPDRTFVTNSGSRLPANRVIVGKAPLNCFTSSSLDSIELPEHIKISPQAIGGQALAKEATEEREEREDEKEEDADEPEKQTRVICMTKHEECLSLERQPVVECAVLEPFVQLFELSDKQRQGQTSLGKVFHKEGLELDDGALGPSSSGSQAAERFNSPAPSETSKTESALCSTQSNDECPKNSKKSKRTLRKKKSRAWYDVSDDDEPLGLEKYAHTSPREGGRDDDEQNELNCE